MPADLLLLSFVSMERFVSKAVLAQCGSRHVEQLSCTKAPTALALEEKSWVKEEVRKC